MRVVGIDYSMTTPALCMFAGESFNIQSCKFHYVATKQKHLLDGQFNGTLYTWDGLPEERFNTLSDWAITCIAAFNPDHVFIENYAYNATGKVFQIGENSGLLKHKLWTSRILFSMVAPTAAKKSATGKGNANKQAMNDSFVAETGLDVRAILGMTDKQWNPSSDIIDSYYICKHGFNFLAANR